MAITADANPEKRLFISLLTRDIPLIAAFLDLIDNSVNAAVEPFAGQLTTADGFQKVFDDKNISPKVIIDLVVSPTRVAIRDNAGGISAEAAQHRVFRFGRDSTKPSSGTDRLSVYGIGLKRAMFKLGDHVQMRSDSVDGGFDLDLRVSKWEQDKKLPWKFDITSRKKVSEKKTGTSIIVTALFDDVIRRIKDGVFETQLRDTISKTYAYFLTKFVVIKVNGTSVEGVDLQVGENHSSKNIDFPGGSCSITAGIGVAQGGVFRDKSSGWFVLCNGRVVVSSDKTPLTGWGAGSGLPLFQPKHRPFLGTVFFVSQDPELLPWTTTKSGINEDSSVWQIAKREMVAVGRVVISFLDGRYTDEGTEVASKELVAAGGEKRVSVLSAAVGKTQSFATPTAKKSSSIIRVQYDAKVSDVKKIATYLRRPAMSASEIGRHTFSFFLKNEVGED